MNQVKPMGNSTATESVKHEFSDAANRSKEAVSEAAKDASEQGQIDIAALRDDLNALKDTVRKFISTATNEVAASARQVTSDVAGRINSTAGELAERGADAVSATTDQAKTIVAEFESMARRNPIGALAAAAIVGILIGMMGRRN
jgi:ElaB/YqjD/DUF883 family membrane-anchored ribosome-binding protein